MTPNGRKKTARATTVVLAGLCAIAAAHADEAATAQTTSPDDASRSFQIRPTLSLEVNASDNIRRTADNRQSDIVFVPDAGLSITGEVSHLKMFLDADLRYYNFLNESSLDRLTGNLLTHGTLTAVPGFLFVDASAQISDEFLKVTDQSPTGLPNGNSQTRIINTQVSPYITTELFDDADLTLRARIADVQFSELEGMAPSTAPSDSIIYQGGGLLTNGPRSRIVQWRLSADYTLEDREDGSEFSSADGLAGVTVRVSPKIHLIGRVGYELVNDPTINDIRDVIWAGGATYTIGEASEITAERRHRFGRDAWFANMNLAMNSQFSVTGGYEERLESEQIRLSRSLNEIFEQTGSLPAAPTQVSLGEDLIDDTFFVKDARLGARYRTDETTFDLSAILSERDFTSLNTHDQTAGVSTRFSERLPANLRLELSGSYNATLEARIGQVETQTYSASGGVTYVLSGFANANLTYTWAQTNGLDTISENLISASLSKSF
jgi:uncharacterized protein (PEP-CTERM system associated)